MSTSSDTFPSGKSVTLLSRLLFSRDRSGSVPVAMQPELLALSRHEFQDMVELAHLNHVVVRGLEAFLAAIRGSGDQRQQWAEKALAAERGRIDTAILFLKEICRAFEQRGFG